MDEADVADGWHETVMKRIQVRPSCGVCNAIW